jgi:hypothetical protein
MALRRQRLSQRRKAARYAGTRGTGNPDTDVTLPMRPAEVQSEMWLSRTDFTNLLRSAVLAAGSEEAARDAGAGREEAARDPAQPAGVSPAGPDAPAQPSTDPTADLGSLPWAPSPSGPSSSDPSPGVGISAEVHPAPIRPVNPSVDVTLAELPPPPCEIPAPSVLAASSGVAAASQAPSESQAPSGDPDSSRPALPPEVPDLSSVTTIPLNVALADLRRRRLRGQHLERFAAAGVLAALLLGAAASAPLIVSQHRAEPPAAAEGVAGNPAPAAPLITIPKPEPDSSHGGVQARKDLPDGDEAAPVAASAGTNTSASKLAPSRGTDPPASRTVRPVPGGSGRSATPAEKPVPAPQRSDRIPPEVYPWYDMAAHSASDSSRAHFRPGPPPYPYDASPQ